MDQLSSRRKQPPSLMLAVCALSHASVECQRVLRSGLPTRAGWLHVVRMGYLLARARRTVAESRAALAAWSPRSARDRERVEEIAELLPGVVAAIPELECLAMSLLEEAVATERAALAQQTLRSWDTAGVGRVALARRWATHLKWERVLTDECIRLDQPPRIPPMDLSPDLKRWALGLGGGAVIQGGLSR